MAEMSIMERFAQEYRERIGPGASMARGATAESLRVAAIFRRHAKGVPRLLLSAMADVEPVRLLLLMADALSADEIDPVMVEKLRAVLKIDRAELPNPWDQAEPAT